MPSLKEILSDPRTRVAGALLVVGACGDLLRATSVPEEVRREMSSPPGREEQLKWAQERAEKFETLVHKEVGKNETIIFVSDLTDPSQFQGAYEIIRQEQERQLKIDALRKQLFAQRQEKEAIRINNFRLDRPWVDFIVGMAGLFLAYGIFNGIYNGKPTK